METCGLTAEYNPFHRGHARQLGQIREIVGPDGGLVVCLSGPFCQHGVPALLDKGTRAEIALRQGADLVLELPQAFAVASAERFAEGAIETLLATGVVRRIAYGSECPEHHSAIREVAALLAEEPPELAEAIREGIRRGKGFAASRAEAAARLSGGQAVLTILQSPNAILAVEYEKALMKARLRGDSNTADGIATHALPLFEKEKYAASQIRRIIAAAQACRDHERGQGRSGHLYQEICQYLTSVLPPESTAAVMQSFCPLFSGTRTRSAGSAACREDSRSVCAEPFAAIRFNAGGPTGGKTRIRKALRLRPRVPGSVSLTTTSSE